MLARIYSSVFPAFSFPREMPILPPRFTNFSAFLRANFLLSMNSVHRGET